MNRYHTFIQRLVAGIIDGIILTIFNLVMDAVFFGDSQSVITFVFYNGISIFYSVYMHGKYGQTFGKMALKVKVVQHADETRLIGYRAAFLRDSVWIGLVTIEILLAIYQISDFSQASYILSLLSGGWFLAELVTMFFNKKRRAVHDLLAGSVVIDITQPTNWEKRMMEKDRLHNQKES